MNPAVFREYDIRGLAEKDFDADFALLLGKVHGTAIAEMGGTKFGSFARGALEPHDVDIDVELKPD